MQNLAPVFNSVTDLKNSSNSFQACYLLDLKGMFILTSKNEELIDDFLIVQRNDKKIYIREEYQTKGIIRPEWFGAKGDGKKDDYQAFVKAIKKVAEVEGTLVTGAKKYHSSKPITFPNAPRIKNCDWMGNGAVLDNEIIISGQDVTIRDLSVENSPGNGFSWFRGQGGYFYNLKASGCKKAGFLLGGKKGAQVAWACFHSLVAKHNNDGFILDGSHVKNWVNANICDAFIARANSRYGIYLTSKANYNTFNGLHCEGNGKEDENVPAMYIDRSRDNVFVGGQLVTKKQTVSSVVVDRGANNVYVGGRYVAGNNTSKKAIDAPRSKIEMSRQVIRKPKKGAIDDF